jgi:hypothetical protein
MEQTAEELIAMGRGKLIAAESLRDFAASSTPLRVNTVALSRPASCQVHEREDGTPGRSLWCRAQRSS